MPYVDRAERERIKATFEEPLRTFIDVDSEGHASLSYPMRAGAMEAQMNHVCRLLAEARATKRQAERRELVARAAAYAEKQQAETAKIADMWARYLAERDAK